MNSTPDLGIACPVQVQDLAGQDAKVGRGWHVFSYKFIVAWNVAVKYIAQTGRGYRIGLEHITCMITAWANVIGENLNQISTSGLL